MCALVFVCVHACVCVHVCVHVHVCVCVCVCVLDYSELLSMSHPFLTHPHTYAPTQTPHPLTQL